MYVTTGRWFIKKNRPRVLRALKELARKVQSSEPGTLAYRIHTPGQDSLPPASPNEVVFIEVYKNKKAFLAHLQGKDFTDFVRRYGNLFVADVKGGPFMTFEQLEPFAGFSRERRSGARR